MWTFLKVTLFAGLVMAGAGAVLGKERLHRCASYARTAIHDAVDQATTPDEEERIRERLEELRKSYPERISVLVYELSDVDAEIQRIADDRKLCDRVVTLCDRDLEELERASSSVSATKVRAAEIEDIAAVRTAYVERRDTSAGLCDELRGQKSLLESAIRDLRREHQSLQAELSRIEHDLDAIRRNERMIEIAESNRTDREPVLSQGDLDSLKRVRATVAKRRAEQEEKLSQLKQQRLFRGYESRTAEQSETRYLVQ